MTCSEIIEIVGVGVDKPALGSPSEPGRSKVGTMVGVLDIELGTAFGVTEMTDCFLAAPFEAVEAFERVPFFMISR